MANDNSTPEKLSQRQHATIWAALRFWQRGLEQDLIGDEIEIARCGSGGPHEAPELTIAEIDELCDRLNWAEITLIPNE